MSIINTALIGKLKKTKANKDNVLELDNTQSFVPTSDFHPSTKKYVDDLVGGTNTAENISYDNSLSGIDSTDVQDAIDEIYNNSGTRINVFSKRTTEDFTATEGQTLFSTSLDLFDVEIFYNGIKLDEEDYSVAGSVITLQEACEANDNIEVIDYGSQDLTGETFITSPDTPVNPHIGVVWQDTSVFSVPIIKIWDGSAWISLSNVEYAYDKQSFTVGTSTGDYDGDLSQFPCRYTVGLVEIYYNGLKLNNSEYTATDGISVSLNSPGSLGDSIEIMGFSNTTNGYYYTKDEVDDLFIGQADDTASTTGTTQQIVDTFDKYTYSSADYLINIKDGSNSNTQKITLHQDETNAELVTYANLGTDLGTFNIQINGSNVELLFTPVSPTCTLKFKKELI